MNRLKDAPRRYACNRPFTFFDPATWTVTYVVYQEGCPECAIIDPVLDYDSTSGRTSTASAAKVIAFVREHELRAEWLLETHAHADHISAAPYVRHVLGGRIAIGEDIRWVQGVFKQLFNLEPEFRLDGSHFDHLFEDGETFDIGGLTAKAIHVPGHTPADMPYQIGDTVIVGDTLFMPDTGTARFDFPGGNAHELYGAIRKLLDLPGETRFFTCHDYPPEGRGPAWQTIVRDQRNRNIHVRNGVTEEQFVAMRQARDVTLAMPTLILPSVQVNIRAGKLPLPEANGVRYLKIPLNAI